MRIESWLKTLADQGGSDLYLSTGAPPCAKFDGELKPIASEVLKPGEIAAIAREMMDETQQEEFHRELELNLAVSIAGVGRFRVNVFNQRNQASVVARHIVTDIPNWQDLGLPPILPELIMKKRGLILFVGATGSGKSTSLAALIDQRNSNSAGHIVTIEDPIEFVHEHKKSIITQREVGIDTESFEAALKSSLRQAPDVILIGEIRSQETMEYALSFAETGHLCVATLHANNANQAIDRIMHLVPKEKHDKLKYDLALNLRAIVAQQLVPSAKGEGREAAIEILLNSPMVAELIKKGDIGSIKETMAKSKEMGMQTFDQALFELYKQRRINYADALHYADSPNDLRLMIKLQNNEQQGAGFLQGVTVDGLDSK